VLGVGTIIAGGYYAMMGGTPPQVASGIPQMANSGQSTGRTIAGNLNEQFAMQQVQSNPLFGATTLPFQMGDTRWPGVEGWVKMENVVRLADGTNIAIHFVYNEFLNLVDDFKFK